MSTQKPTLPSGVRDIHPSMLILREYILSILKKYFHRYGFMPLETPAIESLGTLMGKYGEEGDQLIFKILNSGNFRKKLPAHFLEAPSREAILSLAEKGLRYDLTLPLARYIAQNRHNLVFPFKRSQIQPVWRADRPQKGRYREFYQCDIDIVGSNSLFAEAEIIALVHEAMTELKIQDFSIALNHRNIFTILAATIGKPEKEQLLCRILDKRDKISHEKLLELFQEAGFEQSVIQKINWIFQPLPSHPQEQLAYLKKNLGDHPLASKLLEELTLLHNYLHYFELPQLKIAFTPTLARGMDYYTGTIFEIITTGSINLGSLGGGGRYDKLTEIFGLKNVSGVGISFGLERIYDFIVANDLLPHQLTQKSQLLILPMLQEAEELAIRYLSKLRKNGIPAELLPTTTHFSKGMRYAQRRNIPWVAILGEEEITNQYISLKEMQKGVQKKYKFDEIIYLLRKK